MYFLLKTGYKITQNKISYGNKKPLSGGEVTRLPGGKGGQEVEGS